MEKVIYLIMVRQKDSFNIIYAGDCEHTSDNAFFTENPNYECWIKQSRSEKSLYLAIFPMFESGNDERKKIIDRVITRYNPICNVTIDHKTPDYKIRPKQNSQNLPSEKTLCPCCGSEMKIDKVFENTTIIRCTECGLSDTKLHF